jgi:hypothetical protein
MAQCEIAMLFVDFDFVVRWQRHEYKLFETETYYKPESDGTLTVCQRRILQPFPTLVHYFQRSYEKIQNYKILTPFFLFCFQITDCCDVTIRVQNLTKKRKLRNVCDPMTGSEETKLPTKRTVSDPICVIESLPHFQKTSTPQSEQFQFLQNNNIQTSQQQQQQQQQLQLQSQSQSKSQQQQFSNCFLSVSNYQFNDKSIESLADSIILETSNDNSHFFKDITTFSNEYCTFLSFLHILAIRKTAV